MGSGQERINTIELIPFAERYGLKVETVIKRIRKEGIPGILLMNNKYTVMEGTRYPYDKRKIKKSFGTDRKRLELLRAIKDDRYIDERILKVEKIDFDAFLADYYGAGFIEIRECENQYGANQYRTTMKGNRTFKEEKEGNWLQYMKRMGVFAGTMISYATQ